MIKLKDLPKLLDRLQVLFQIYTSGEDSLPRELKPLFMRCKKNEVDNGEEVFYCKCLSITSIDAIYRFQLRSDNDFNPLSKTEPDNLNVDMIITDTDEYCLDKETGEIYPVIFDERSNLIKMFIPKNILQVENIHNVIVFIACIISTFFDVFVPEGISYAEKAKYSLITTFINIVFSYGLLNDTKAIKDSLKFDNESFQPNIINSVISFVEANYNFNTQSASEILKSGIEKFENGDNKFWSDITKEVRFDKIISAQGW